VGAFSYTKLETMTLFSFLLPTRGRPEGVQQFLQSVAETTEELDQIEVVLGVDDDDLSSHHFTHDRVRLKTTVFPHGLTMGRMNRACFDVSCGRYIFLMNDDVVSCTEGWDRRVRQAFAYLGDDIALIHVNDGIFGDKLCTFPLLSRQACLEIGLCPPDYRRYKIDDHIMETYTLLERLGYPRIIYLDDVIFRHDNFKLATEAGATAVFFAPGGRAFAANQEDIAFDVAFYEHEIDIRKRDALKLAAMIDRGRDLAHLALLLSDIHDPHCYRRRRVSRLPSQPGAKPLPRVAVGLVTSDVRSVQARRCIAGIKQSAGESILVILDSGTNARTSRPYEMNRILDSCDAEFLLLLEDDVLVGPGFLEGLLGCMDDSTALVAPLYEDFAGHVVSSGVYMLGQGLCLHQDLTDRPTSTRVCQAVRSGALLIDLKKCGELRFAPQYRVGYFDLDYCLQIWEAGYRVVSTPVVTARRTGRVAGALDSIKARLALEAEEATLTEDWIDSGRLHAMAQRCWLRLEELHPKLETFAQVASLLTKISHLDADEFQRRWALITPEIRRYPLFRQYAAVRVRLMLDQLESAPIPAIKTCCRQLLTELEELPRPVELLSGVMRKTMERLTHNIRRRPFPMRLAMALTRTWRNLMAQHEHWPRWIQRLAAPIVDWVERAYEYASNVTDVESLGCHSGYCLLRFDGLVCGVPASLSQLGTGRQLALRPDVVVATTVCAVKRKINRIQVI
jgi:hypothetical protein